MNQFTFWSLGGLDALSWLPRMDRRNELGRNKYSITAQINSIDINIKFPPSSAARCPFGIVGTKRTKKKKKKHDKNKS